MSREFLRTEHDPRMAAVGRFSTTCLAAATFQIDSSPMIRCRLAGKPFAGCNS